MSLEALVNRCCKRQVTQEEYLDFLDPISYRIASQTAIKDDKKIVFFYDIVDDEVLSLAITGKDSQTYWLND